MSTPADPALTLLTLLASGASAAELSAVDAPEARALALRVRAAFDTRRRREAELSALVDTARDLASMRDPAGVLDAIARAYDNPTIRRGVVRTLGSALAGSSLREVPIPGAPEGQRP